MIPPRPSASKIPARPLPIGKHCKLMKVVGGFQVSSIRLSLVVGRRFDRGRGNYPEGTGVWPTMAEAKTSMAQWDKFIEANQSRTKYE